MKNRKQITLLQRTSKAFILISSILVLVSAPILYFYISNLMEQETEEELYSRSFRLEHYVNENRQLLELPPAFEVVKAKKLYPEELKDTLIYDPSQEEMELFRELNIYKNIGDIDYRITVRSMVVETQDIVLVTLTYFIISLLLVFLIQFYFSWAWNRKIWKPFFQNLEAMKAFSLESENSLNLSDSEIQEFSELKEEIGSLTSKVIADYQNLKQFTENISHELQTALAIMQAKLENFLNESAVTNQQFSQLTSLQKDIQRLGKLNKKLVLLATLEQRQNRDFEIIDVNTLVKEAVRNFEEISSIHIKIQEENTISINSDKELIQVLINNLINNAIKHSEGPGKIEIEIQECAFTIKNPGSHKLEDGEKLFNRFYKKNQKSKMGSGLGLAIAKKICDVFKYKLNYSHKQGKHQFEILFK